MHAYTSSLEARLKEPMPTSCSTCEMHSLKNLKLAHYVDRLKDENDELRKLMGWLSGHDPQLRMMIEAFKRQDGEGLGANKVGEGSEENIPEPPKTHHKNEKASEEKPVDRLSGEKPSEQPQSKRKPKLVRFHCVYCGKEGHKDEFFFKRKREGRMAKEWANKDRHNPSHGVPKTRMPLPWGKAVVRSVPAWGDASSHSRGAVLERVFSPAWLGGQIGPA
jgi:hypothetical protein